MFGVDLLFGCFNDGGYIFCYLGGLGGMWFGVSGYFCDIGCCGYFGVGGY